LNRRDEIKAETNEIHQIVTGQRFAAQVRVHESQAAKATIRCAEPSNVRKVQFPSVAHDYVVDLPRTMDENAYLPPSLERRSRKISRQLGGCNITRRHPSAIKTLEGFVRGGR
jgi:hypothetical protein